MSAQLKEYKNKKSKSMIYNIPNDIKVVDSKLFARRKIKTVIFGDNVEEIKPGAFNKCLHLKEVVLNEGLKKIGETAFLHTKVKKITVPSTVEAIEGGAFVDMEVSIANSNKRYDIINNCLIEKDTQRLVSGNTKSIIPLGVREIDWHAFYKSKIESIEIPSSVKEISEATFIYCSKLKSVILNEGLKVIWESAFAGTKIESIMIPSTVERIFGDSFNKIHFSVSKENKTYEVIEGCLIEKKTKKIISVGKTAKVPSEYYGIRLNAFFCSDIETIEIPSTVEKLDSGALYGASKLKSVIFNEGLKEIGDTAVAATKIQSIVFPSTVESIEECAFMDCPKLRFVKLNRGLQSIGDSAFYKAKIRTIVIPDTVRRMGKFVFSNCKNLKTIYCMAKSKPEEWDDEWNAKEYSKGCYNVVWGYTGK